MTLTEILSNEELRRHEFPVTRDKIFLAHAGDCPLPRRVAEAIADYARAVRHRRPGEVRLSGDPGAGPQGWRRNC